MSVTKLNVPDAQGHFGPYGGIFVAETFLREDEIFSIVPFVFFNGNLFVFSR